jgi:hypothetical protein
MAGARVWLTMYGKLNAPHRAVRFIIQVYAFLPFAGPGVKSYLELMDEKRQIIGGFDGDELKGIEEMSGKVFNGTALLL